MKKSIAMLIFLLMIALFVFADSQQGRTEGNLSDSSFTVQGYYKGASSSTTNSITLTLTDYNNRNLSYSTQNTQGASVVNVSDSHLGSNTGTIFSWTMTGTSTSTITLKFTFSVLQAEMNEMFYRPTYTLKMILNPTKKNNNNGDTISNDTFYTSATTPQVVGGGTTTGTKASQSTEFTGGSTVQYSGKTSSNNYGYSSTTWYRSGACTLNISDYEQGIPGSYEYRCWIVTELTTT